MHGLNLTVPEDAKETIKPWDERETTEKFAESNVDDQVRQNIRLNPLECWLTRLFPYSWSYTSRSRRTSE